jgi:hypothetical protein
LTGEARDGRDLSVGVEQNCHCRKLDAELIDFS